MYRSRISGPDKFLTKIGYFPYFLRKNHIMLRKKSQYGKGIFEGKHKNATAFGTFLCSFQTAGFLLPAWMRELQFEELLGETKNLSF